jgi:hypothetical protein
MKRSLRLGLIVLAILVALLPAAAQAGPPDYTCNGGLIMPGAYGTLTITGTCFIQTGIVTVQNGLVVKGTGVLWAASETAHVDVKGGIRVEKDGILFYGCSPSLCADRTGYTVTGGIMVDQAQTAVFHGNDVKGSVSVTGGGGGYNCDGNPRIPVPPGVDFQIPNYTDFEENWVSGSITVSGVQSCWMGFIRNEINGAVTFMNNKLADPDAMEIVTNKINGSLTCTGNWPAAQVGDSAGEANKVTGGAYGECAGL